ncbi:hypothetical protein BH11MYX1_BH11MYX1_55230 [soil metagenome]
MSRSFVLSLILAASACTRWSTETVYGPRQEVERQLLGSPAIEDTSSSDLAGGFMHDSASAGGRHWRESSSIGSFGGNTSSSHMTHCVQQAKVHYKQGYQIVPVASGRVLDVVAGATLAFIGGSIMMFTEASNHATGFPGDPYYMAAPSTTPGLMLGGAALAGGIGLIAYSFGYLPKDHDRPHLEEGSRDLVETEFVESSGCGLPGDPASH